MYEFKYFWIQKYMNSWNSWIHGLWIHMFSEFINYVLWIRCVIQSCYLLRWDAAALPTWQGSFPVLPLAAQHWQATFHCLEVPLWLCPQWVAFETESRKGCWLNELQLQVAKSRNRIDHLNSPCTHTGIKYNHDRFWVNFRLIFNAFVVWGLALILRPDSNSELHGCWGPGCMIGQGGFNCTFLFQELKSRTWSHGLGPSASAMRTPSVHFSLHFMSSAMNS